MSRRMLVARNCLHQSSDKRPFIRDLHTRGRLAPASYVKASQAGIALDSEDHDKQQDLWRFATASLIDITFSDFL